MSEDTRTVSLKVNGARYTAQIPVRTLLCDFLRHQIGLTGTHVGCEQGVCGACTVLIGGEPVRSCLMLAVQAERRLVETVESLAAGDELSESNAPCANNTVSSAASARPGS